MAVKNALAGNFNIRASYNGRYSDYPLGNKPPPAAGNTYYVRTTGNDANAGTTGSPFLTIGKGISVLGSGDTLIVGDGTYSGLVNFIDDMPSGVSSAQPTTIRAENVFGVRIQNGGSLSGYQECLIRIGTFASPGTNYVKVDGFILDHADSINAPHTGTVHGNYNRIMRCIFKRSGQIDTYGGWCVVYGSYNLLEDVAGVGCARYGFEQGGPDATTQFNIRRRVVGRFDYSGSNQPKRTITTYGNDTGTGVADNLDQNCIALDGPDVDTGRVSFTDVKYSSIGCGKKATRNLQKGCIVVNDYSVYAGIWVNTTGDNCEATDCAVWGLVTAAYGLRSDTTGDTTATVNHVTTDPALTSPWYKNGSGTTPANSKTTGTPTNILDNTPGAVIMMQRGVSGTLYGETGYDTLTADLLWPWPYQSTIKTVFSEANDPSALPADYRPRSNTTTRGFCAAGTGLYGGPITLSSYIWEITGTACPAQYAS